MLKKQITISKDEILIKYNNLNKRIRYIIDKLYGENTNDLTDNVNINLFEITDGLLKSNDELNTYINKTGVYIFLKDNIPVYIGLGGKGTTQGLKGRIENQFSAIDNGYSNLVYKIIKIEERLDNEGLKNNIPDIEDIGRILQLRKKYYKKSKNEKSSDKAPEIDFKRLQNIILKYTSSLIVIDCGEKEFENTTFAETLEVVLIALFNSKYNG